MAEDSHHRQQAVTSIARPFDRAQALTDQNTGRSRAELLHNNLTLSLLHVTVHGRDSELAGLELVGEPVDFSPRVAEDDGLGDGNGLVQVGQGVELPVLLLDGDVELLDTFKRQLVALDENTDRVAHELGGDFKNVGGHGGGQENDLSCGRQQLEDIVDLVLETTRKHLIGLVKAEDLHVVGLERATLDHVKDTARGADNDVDTLLELGHGLANRGSTDGGEALDVHVVTDGDDDLLDLLSQLAGRGEDKSLALLERDVDRLENGDGESGGLASSRLGLGDNIVPGNDGHDGTLLDGRRALETGQGAQNQHLEKTDVVEDNRKRTRRRRYHGGARDGGSSRRSCCVESVRTDLSLISLKFWDAYSTTWSQLEDPDVNSRLMISGRGKNSLGLDDSLIRVRDTSGGAGSGSSGGRSLSGRGSVDPFNGKEMSVHGPECKTTDASIFSGDKDDSPIR